MSEPAGKRQKKDIVKEIILDLHKGLSAQDARDKFEKEVGNISSAEITWE
ncbi:MAG: DUF438 domain-containing protein [Thermodesulfobacteriota bacterium]|jgi:DUF438 domain-containing protein